MSCRLKCLKILIHSYSRYRKTPTKDCITSKTYFYVVYVRKIATLQVCDRKLGSGTIRHARHVSAESTSPSHSTIIATIIIISITRKH